MSPDSKAAGSPFAVLRDALDGRAGVGRLALHGRKYLVAVLPRNRALMLYTLRTAGEVRALADIDELEFANARVKPEELKLARQVLRSFETETDLSAFTDHYQEALRAMIASRGPGEVVETAAGPGSGKGKVVNLMEALRQSLAKVSAEKPTAIRGARRKPARVIAHPSGARTARRRAG